MNTLTDKKQRELRLVGILQENEVAYYEGDLLVAKNVVTNEKRVIENLPIRENVSTKRLLKG